MRVKLTFLFLSLVVASTAFAAHHMAGENAPAADGKAVIEYLNQQKYQDNWQLWPGKSELYKGTHPHGAFLTTYVSAGAYKAIEEKAGGIPDGGFIVKENYSPEKKLAAVTVMYKKSGYNPEGGDWFWLKYAPDGKIEKEGKVGGCIGCHSAVQTNDWLFIGPLK